MLWPPEVFRHIDGDTWPSAWRTASCNSVTLQGFSRIFRLKIWTSEPPNLPLTRRGKVVHARLRMGV